MPEISFDCLPLRSVTRLDVPLDASPKFRKFCQQVVQAIEEHGTLNTYYLHQAECVFHLTNSDEVGTIVFKFEGTVMTNESDESTERCCLDIELTKETCDWLTEPIVQWFRTAVTQAVRVEFDRFITAGDLEQTKRRIEEMQAKSDEAGGFVGMYL